MQFDDAEKKKQELVSKVVSGAPESMEAFFGEVLMDIVWPRETLVSFEVRDGGKRLAFDVDLPEIEDMPTKTASVPQRGYKLSVKDLGPTTIQKMYAKHTRLTVDGPWGSGLLQLWQANVRHYWQHHCEQQKHG